MDDLALAALPLPIAPGPNTRVFVVRIDEARGTVSWDPAVA
ncbi:hypothetical protein [Curtobacterium sp. MCSS17_007]|nr:hypothetical protein [Curtobacterium sp. MCSS17_007]WIE76088.1 hypothetical protein DEJ22_002155 [Curtobacterium sp. MCSS17_007]